MPTSLMNEIIRQTPTLGVLVFVVWIFLKHLDKRDETIKSIGEDCHEVQRDAIKAINDNSKALGENGLALKEVNYTLKRMNGHS